MEVSYTQERHTNIGRREYGISKNETCGKGELGSANIPQAVFTLLCLVMHSWLVLFLVYWERECDFVLLEGLYRSLGLRIGNHFHFSFLVA